MDTLKLRSFAKLNLTFEILKALPNGFHSIRTLFQSIDLADTLHFKLVPGLSAEPFMVEITEGNPVQIDQVQASKSSVDYDLEISKHAQFPLGESNLISKAARRFESISGCGRGLKLIVRVEKQIPIAAGLAGGSGNAAAALKAMQLFFPQQCLSKAAESIAASLGSDINFCLYGGTQIGTNRGEILQPLDITRKFRFLIVKPRHIAISTPWIFKRFDESLEKNAKTKTESETDDISVVDRTRGLLDAIVSGSCEQVAQNFFNAFEHVCFESHPEVRTVRDAMLSAGCLSAHITGSGPTLFGLIREQDNGLEVRAKLLEFISGTEKVDVDCWLNESKEVGLEIC